MKKFITSCEKEYIKEDKKREKIYLKACKKSGELCDEWQDKKTLESQRKFFEAFRKIDIAYLNWKNGIEYKYEETL